MAKRYLFRRRRTGEILWSGLKVSSAAVLALFAPVAAAAAPFLR